jgi:addiction module RelE/StbE family toxin
VKYHISEKLLKKFSKIKKKQPDLLDQIRKQLVLFGLNENYPSLRNHKLKGEMDDIWSISVGMNFRLIYFIEDGEAYFFECGNHDEVYR